MARPDLYGMPETNAAKLQGDNDVLRAENERLRAVVVYAAACNPDASGNNAITVLRNIIKQARHALSNESADEIMSHGNAAAEIDKLRLLLVRWWATLDQSEDVDLVQDTVSALKDYRPKS